MNDDAMVGISSGDGHGNEPDLSRLVGSAQRRFAVNACVSCRQRKTKCDEARPACGRCARLELPCTYLQAPAPRDTVLITSLDQRLQRLEAKIDLLCQSSSLAARPTSSYALGTTGGLASAGVAGGREEALFSPRSPQPDWLPGHRPGLGPGVGHFGNPASLFIYPENEAVLAIPRQHSTAPQYMLLWPCVAGRFGINDVLYPLIVETARTRPRRHPLPPRALASDGLSRTNCTERLTFSQFGCLASSYFQHFHPRNMILDEREFYSHLAPRILRGGFDRTPHSCLLLLVLAVGSISAVEDGFVEWRPAESGDTVTPEVEAENENVGTDEVGEGFFHLAASMFSEVCDNTWTSVRCWLLMAFYHSLKLRVYEQWLAISRAAMAAMLLLRMNVGSKQVQCQLFWVIYLQESQLLAELDFPSSGISVLEHSVALPFAQDDDGDQVETEELDEAQREHRLIFLAEISLRRLLNRVHFHMYRSETNVLPGASPVAVSSPFADQAASMISELDSQLESWRHHLPQTIQASFATDYETQAMTQRRTRPVREKLIGTLKSRYFAAKAIIFRPFVYRVLHAADPERLPSEDATGAATALEAALQVPLCGGLLCDNLRLMPLLINPARSFYALGILLEFISKTEHHRSFFPQHWGCVNAIKARLADEVAPRSPLTRRDLEILTFLTESERPAPRPS